MLQIWGLFYVLRLIYLHSVRARYLGDILLCNIRAMQYSVHGSYSSRRYKKSQMTVLIKRQLMFIEINNKLAKCHNFIRLRRENSQE